MPDNTQAQRTDGKGRVIVPIGVQTNMDAVEAKIAAMTSPAAIVQIMKGAAQSQPVMGPSVNHVLADQQKIDVAGFALGEELRFISAELVRFMEQELKSDRLIPGVSDQPPLGAQEYAWNYLQAAGAAQRTQTPGNNPPQAIVNREGRNTAPLIFSEAGWSFTDFELAQAALIPGFNLDMERGRRAVRMIAEDVDNLRFIGDAVWGITGLLTQTTIVQGNVINPGAALSGLTNAALFSFFDVQFRAYLNTFGDTPANFHWRVLLPKTVYLQLKTTRDVERDQSVAQDLQTRYADLGFAGFEYVRHCATAGTGASQMMAIYPVSAMDGSPQHVTATTFLQAAPERRFWSIQNDAVARTGGVIMKDPIKVRYVYNL